MASLSLSLSLADVWLDALDLEDGSARPPAGVPRASGQWRRRQLPMAAAAAARPAAAGAVVVVDSGADAATDADRAPHEHQEQQDGGGASPRGPSPSTEQPEQQEHEQQQEQLETELLAEARAMAANPQRWRMGPKLLEVHERQARAGVSEYYTAEHLARLWRHSACRRRRQRRQEGGDNDEDAADFSNVDFDMLFPSARGSKVLCKAMGHPRDCRACVTCHFCRQKTVDPKTRCACELGGARHQPGGAMRGAWCASCLALRMGERLEDALDDPEWRCPCCRDLCNCSGAGCLRARRGLEPTNQLSSEARGLGYPSVAHYLVLTHLCSRPELMAPVMADCGRRRVVVVADGDGPLSVGGGAAAAEAAMAAAAAALAAGANDGSEDAAAQLLLQRGYDLDAIVQGRLRAVRQAIVRQVDAQVAAMRLELPLPSMAMATAAATTATRAAAAAVSAAAPTPPPPPPIAGRGFCTGILELDDADDGEGDGEDGDDAWGQGRENNSGGEGGDDGDGEWGGGTLRALLSRARQRRARVAVRSAAAAASEQRRAGSDAPPSSAAAAAVAWLSSGQQQQQQQGRPSTAVVAAAAAAVAAAATTAPSSLSTPAAASTARSASSGAWWVRSALWRGGATLTPVAAAWRPPTQSPPPPPPAPAVAAPAAHTAAPNTALPPPTATAPPFPALPSSSQHHPDATARVGRFQTLAAYVQGLLETAAAASGPGAPAPPPGAAAYARVQIDDLMQREFASGWLEDVAVSEFALRRVGGDGGGSGGEQSAGGVGSGEGTTTIAAAAAAPGPQTPSSSPTLSHDELRAAVDLLLMVATKGPPRAAAEAAERLVRRGPFVDVARSDARARAVVLRGTFDLLTTRDADGQPDLVAALAASAMDVIAVVAQEARALRRLLVAPRDHTGPLRLGPVDLPADRRPGSAAARLAQLSALLRADEELLALALARLQAAAEALGRGARAFLLAPAPGKWALAALLDGGGEAAATTGGSSSSPPFGRALRSAALAAAYTVVASAAPDIADDRAWGGQGGVGGGGGLPARLAELRDLERAARQTLLAPVERLVETAYPSRRGCAVAVEVALSAAVRGVGGAADAAATSGFAGLLQATAAANDQQQQPQPLSLRQQQQQQMDAQAVGSIAVEVLARLYALQAQALCSSGAGGGAATATPAEYTTSPSLAWTACVETPLHAPFISPDLFWTHCSSLRARHVAAFGAAHALAAAPSLLTREAVRPLLRLWLRGLVDYGRPYSVGYLTLVLAAHPRTGMALFAPAPAAGLGMGGAARRTDDGGGLVSALRAAEAAAEADGDGNAPGGEAQAVAAVAWSDVVRDGATGDRRAALARRVLKALLLHGGGGYSVGGGAAASSAASERLTAPHPLMATAASQPQQQPTGPLEGPQAVLFVCSKLVDVLNARKAELARAQVGEDDPRRLLHWQRAASAVALAAADVLAESAASPTGAGGGGQNTQARAAAAATVPLLLEWVALAFRTAFAAVCSARAQMVAGGRDAASAAAEAAGILPSSAIVHYLPALSAIGRLEDLHGFRLAEEARPVVFAGRGGGGSGGGGGGRSAPHARLSSSAAAPCLRRALLGAVSAVLDEPSALDDPPHAEDQAAVLHVARALARAGAMDAAPALAHHALGVHVRLALEEAASAFSSASAPESAAMAGGMPAWTWRRAVNALRLLECLFRERAAREPATLALLAPCTLRPLVALLSLPPPLPPPAVVVGGGGAAPSASSAKHEFVMAEAHALRLERYSLLQRRAMGAVAALLLGEGATAEGAAAAAATTGGSAGAAGASVGGSGPSGAALPSVRPDPAASGSLGGGGGGSHGCGAASGGGGGIDGPLRRREPLTPPQLDAAKRALLHVAVRWCLTAVDCATTTAADVAQVGATAALAPSSDRLQRLQRVALAIAPSGGGGGGGGGSGGGGGGSNPAGAPASPAAAAASSLSETDAVWWPLRCGGAQSSEHALFAITGRAEAAPQIASEWARAAPASATAAARDASAAASAAAAAQPNARKRAMLARRSLSRAALAFLRRLADEGGAAGARWAAPALPFARAALDALLRPRPAAASGASAGAAIAAASPLRDAYGALYGALVARGALPVDGNRGASSSSLLALPGEGAPLLQIVVLGGGGGGMAAPALAQHHQGRPPPPPPLPPHPHGQRLAPRPAASVMASVAGGAGGGGGDGGGNGSLVGSAAAAAAAAETPQGPCIRRVPAYRAAARDDDEGDGEVSWQPGEQRRQQPEQQQRFASVSQALSRAAASAAQRGQQQASQQQQQPTVGVGASAVKPPVPALAGQHMPLRGCVVSALPRLTKDFGKPVLILLLADAPAEDGGSLAAPPQLPVVAKVLVADPAVLESLGRQMRQHEQQQEEPPPGAAAAAASAAATGVPVPLPGATVTLSRALWTAPAFLVKGNSGCALTYSPPTASSASFARVASATVMLRKPAGGAATAAAAAVRGVSSAAASAPAAAGRAQMAPPPARRPVAAAAIDEAAADDQSQPMDQEQTGEGGGGGGGGAGAATPGAAGAPLLTPPTAAAATTGMLLNDSQATVAR